MKSMQQARKDLRRACGVALAINRLGHFGAVIDAVAWEDWRSMSSEAGHKQKVEVQVVLGCVCSGCTCFSLACRWGERNSDDADAGPITVRARCLHVNGQNVNAGTAAGSLCFIHSRTRGIATTPDYTSGRHHGQFSQPQP